MQVYKNEGKYINYMQYCVLNTPPTWSLLVPSKNYLLTRFHIYQWRRDILTQQLFNRLLHFKMMQNFEYAYNELIRSLANDQSSKLNWVRSYNRIFLSKTSFNFKSHKRCSLSIDNHSLGSWPLHQTYARFLFYI